MKDSCLLFLMLQVSVWACCQSYPAVREIEAPPLFNEQLRYTSSLLEVPKAQVRILVYGQSISEQLWWKEVKLYFEKKFPKASIDFTNKAIGGFSAERLKLTVTNDIVSLYPDLILFHDYGNEADYEEIIRIMRTKTTADIAVQTDHMAQQGQEWHDRHSNVWLPELCKKYGLALIDVRKYWKLYLQQNNLQIKDLLTDGVHLNGQGNHLMAAIIKKYFDHLSYQAADQPRLKVMRRGKDFSFKKGRIDLPFSGNRIDVVADPEAGGSAIQLLVDGQPVKNNAACFYHTRPSLKPGGPFLTNIGLLLAMELSNKVVEETWFLTIVSIDSIQQQIRFSIKGSQTGEDGSGNSRQPFTSNSGKITIHPHAWFVRKSKGDFAQFNWLKPGDVLQWEIKTMCHDSLVLQPPARQTLFQGIRNTRHQLKITGPEAKHIKEIFVYAPMLKEDEEEKK